MRIRRRRPAARITSASRSRATSDLSTTGGRYFVTGEGGVGVADVGRLSFRRAPRRGRFTASVLLPYPAHQGERGYRPLADPQPRRGGRLISACRPSDEISHSRTGGRRCPRGHRAARQPTHSRFPSPLTGYGDSSRSRRRLCRGHTTVSSLLSAVGARISYREWQRSSSAVRRSRRDGPLLTRRRQR